MNPEKKKRIIELLKEGDITSKEFKELYKEYMDEQEAMKEHLAKDEIVRREQK